MDALSSPRPSQSSTTDDLLHALCDARRVELELFEGLADSQMLGNRAHFLEPPIWEVGHVGWFQELWIPRHLAGHASLLPGSDGIYDSFNVPYTRRWDHLYPSRGATLEYLGEVLKRSVGRLGGRAPSPEEAYVYTLCALHEDMHAENLTLILQTLGYSRPVLHDMDADAAPPPVDPGYVAGDVTVPGGEFMLG